MSIYCWRDVYERALIQENPVNERRPVVGGWGHLCYIIWVKDRFEVFHEILLTVNVNPLKSSKASAQ